MRRLISTLFASIRVNHNLMTSSEDPPSSLYFLSTQIQARHEDLEQREESISKLQKFKNSNSRIKAPQTKHIAKKRAPKKQKAKVLSLSAFVRETLGSKKKDTQSILEYFSGDRAKVDDFLERMEKATSTSAHLLSKKGEASTLHSQTEWRQLLESISLKFPNLSTKNKRSLKVISQRLECLKEQEIIQGSQDLDMWSQASRQPSDKLTREDMKWLYDLDDEQLDNDTSAVLLDTNNEGPYCLTLSQVFEPEKLEEQDLENREELSLPLVGDFLVDPIVISDSESEPEPLEMLDYIRQDPIPSHQSVFGAESVDVLTSILFPPTYDSKKLSQTPQLFPTADFSPKKSTENVIFSSPVKPKSAEVFKTPSKWPSNLVITSSPLSSKHEDIRFLPMKSSPTQEEFSTARSELEEPEAIFNISPFPSQLSQLTPSTLHPLQNHKRKAFSTTTVEFQGDVDFISDVTPNVKFRKTQLKPADIDVVADSEDDEAEISIIEITKPIETQDDNEPSVLQVPSSPQTV